MIQAPNFFGLTGATTSNTAAAAATIAGLGFSRLNGLNLQGNVVLKCVVRVPNGDLCDRCTAHLRLVLNHKPGRTIAVWCCE